MDLDDIFSENALKQENISNDERVMTLQEISGVTIAAQLWRHSRSVTYLLVCASLHEIEENSLYTHMSNGLPLPASLIDFIMKYVKRMKLPIFDWINFCKELFRKCILSVKGPSAQDNEKTLMSPIDLLGILGDEIRKLAERFPLMDLCWTHDAQIDKLKTIEKCLSDVRLDVSDRYQLACVMCCEGYIEPLWKEVVKENEHDQFLLFTMPEQHPLITYWTYTLTGENHLLERLKRITSTYYQVSDNEYNPSLQELMYVWTIRNRECFPERYFEKIPTIQESRHWSFFERNRFRSRLKIVSEEFLVREVLDESSFDMFSYGSVSELESELTDPQEMLTMRDKARPCTRETMTLYLQKEKKGRSMNILNVPTHHSSIQNVHPRQLRKGGLSHKHS